MKSLVFLFLIVLQMESTWAAPLGSVSTGTGGAGVATVEAGAATFTNPSTIVHLRGRRWFSTVQKDQWGMSLIEKDRDSAIPGAFSFWQTESHEVLGLSFSDFLSRRVSFGTTFQYWQTRKKVDPLKRKSGFNMVAGATWTVLDNLGLAVASENIVTPESEFKDLGLMNTQTRLGANYVYRKWFAARLDFVTSGQHDFENLTPEMGFESYMGQWSVLRFGRTRPKGGPEAWSAGLGADLPRFKVDYAVQWVVEGSKTSRHSIDLAVPF